MRNTSLTLAERQQRWRNRNRAGKVVLQIEVDATRLAAVLADQGDFLKHEDCTREELAHAVKALINAYITRYEREAWPEL
jgi:hypothetical protein